MGKTNRYRFPKTLRLRAQSDFDKVYAADYFAADATLVIRARRNRLDSTRLGLSISKRVGNAVVRNSWKRRIREAFRKQQHELPVGLDLVVRPRRGASCDYWGIYRSLNRLATRLDSKLPKQAKET